MSLLQLAALEFPPKKLFGNRDERMVAERRNHLEVTRFIPVRFTFSKDSGCGSRGRFCWVVDLFILLYFLQRYLRNLFRVMLSSSSSPLRADADGHFHLTKHDICEFCPFFKKGVFEYSSHGTGWLDGTLCPEPFSKPKKLGAFFSHDGRQRITWKVREEVMGRFSSLLSGAQRFCFRCFFLTSPRNAHKITASHRDITTQPRTIFKVNGRSAVLKSVTQNQIRAVNSFIQIIFFVMSGFSICCLVLKRAGLFSGTAAFSLLDSWSDSVIW